MIVSKKQNILRTFLRRVRIYNFVRVSAANAVSFVSRKGKVTEALALLLRAFETRGTAVGNVRARSLRTSAARLSVAANCVLLLPLGEILGSHFLPSSFHREHSLLLKTRSAVLLYAVFLPFVKVLSRKNNARICEMLQPKSL